MKYLLVILFVLRIAFSNTDNLIAHYPFNGNALDVTSNGHNGKVFGAKPTKDRYGRPNSAYRFRGTDYMQFNINVDDWSERTLSLWIKTDQTKRMYLGGWGQDAVYGEQTIDINKEPGKIQATLWDGSGSGHVITKPHLEMLNNEWHHIVIKYKLLDSLYIYFDGKRSASVPVIKLGDPNSIFELGRTQWSINYPEKYFQGAIDDVMIYNRCLTDEEITDLYIDNFNSPIIVYPRNTTDVEFSVRLLWSYIDSALYYDCQVSTQPIFSSVPTYSVTDTSYFIRDLNPTTKYYWRVRAIKPNYTSNWSDTCWFVTGITSIKNPLIKYQLPDKTLIRYYNTKGRIINQSQVSKGIYIKELKSINSRKKILKELR